MKYKIVSAETAAELEEAVNAMIASRWSPLGGVSVAVLHRVNEQGRKGYEESSTEWVYAQAMTRG